MFLHVQLGPSQTSCYCRTELNWSNFEVDFKNSTLARFFYFSVSFSVSAVLFDWIKFHIWNQVVLV